MPSPSPPTIDAFGAWLQAGPSTPRARGRVYSPDSGAIRFAFYGRISTSEYQDPVSSRAWQIESAQRLVAGRGRIVAEFFDPGASRSLPWRRRPQAAALLAAAAGPDRHFDAVVVGEFERAFAGGEAQRVIETLQSFGVQVWLPEAQGPVDLDDAEHRALLMMLGHQSQREVRSRFRVRSAMAAQVREQGRHLGGRPPYGYQLVDAGPHPNKVHAGWGRRRHRLEVDPATAPYIRWIFAWRLEGMSTAGIARVLNERRIPSPAAYDRVRNPHREGAVWTLRTVAAILANPRYTGREVWNRQFTDHREAVPGDRRTSLGPVRVWNPREDWVVSPERMHPALVSDEDFTAVQAITARAMPEDGQVHRYALTGLLVCGLCGRRMSAHWLRRATYRCRHGRTSAHLAGSRAKSVYWAEARITEEILAANPDMAHLAGAEGVASYLRSRGAVIVCTAGSLTVQDASAVTIQEELFAAPEPSPEKSDEPEATVAGSKPVEEPKPEEEQNDESAADEETSRPEQRSPHRRPPARRVWAVKKAWTAQNPTRHHVKRE
ncbi:recombinase family protein [Actinoplanes sp. NEAU-H7]|uniref:Recombinase family protein n=1 Tax=Actinoplanes flavus TaxID=2820290 RepID=A0ABS3UFN7_9ACTN|nr:recombinase family protein [Actinoplanes flavus]MBO3736593.1 recombinase family protein [Actinoplanes flavus]